MRDTTMAVTVYTDGGSRNNPGHAGIGALATRSDEQLFALSEYIGIQTNNWAEYQGAIRALEELAQRDLTKEHVEIRMDSMLVVQQMMGNWKIKEPTLKPQAAKLRGLMEQFSAVTFTHVPREQNSEADALVNKAIDEAQI